jgi:hypothetical protein
MRSVDECVNYLFNVGKVTARAATLSVIGGANPRFFGGR